MSRAFPGVFSPLKAQDGEKCPRICVVITLDSLWTALHTIHSGRSGPTSTGGTRRLYGNTWSIAPSGWGRPTKGGNVVRKGTRPLPRTAPGPTEPRVIRHRCLGGAVPRAGSGDCSIRYPTGVSSRSTGAPPFDTRPSGWPKTGTSVTRSEQDHPLSAVRRGTSPSGKDQKNPGVPDFG